MMKHRIYNLYEACRGVSMSEKVSFPIMSRLL
jgi:hypothetical protein